MSETRTVEDRAMTENRAPRYEYLELPGDLHLALLPTRKLKTVTVVVSLVADLSEETVTQHALLPMVLRRGTSSRPDLQSIQRFLDHLYGASIHASVYKVGEWHVLQFQLDVVNERYVPGSEEILRPALAFLRELIADPLQVAGGFSPEFVEQEKAQLGLAIESLVDSKPAYAAQRLVEEMCADEPYRIYAQGRVADLAQVDPHNLRERHRRALSTYPIYAYVTGDLDASRTRDLVAEWFDDDVFRRSEEAALKPATMPTAPRRVREVNETLEVNQARLHLGYRHGVTYSDPDCIPLLVANGVLGAYSHSKLFQNVREKESLCYSISSAVDRAKGLMFIASGISAETRERTRRIIEEQIDELRAGAISDEELSATRVTLLNSNEMLEDDLVALAALDLRWRLHGRGLDLDEIRNEIRRVGKDDIVRVAGRLELDTVYSLASESNAQPKESPR